MNSVSNFPISQDLLQDITISPSHLLQDDPRPSVCLVCLAKFCYVFRKGLTFLLSHIGLISFVVGYCIMGALMFEALEAENEQVVRS